MKKYIWQQKNWPEFKWDLSALVKDLAKARKMQGMLLGQAKFLQLKEQAEILVEESLSTSAIEGEKLDRDGVRSSVARRLGLPSAGLPEPKRNVDGVVEVLIDATKNHEGKLTDKRLFGWHAALFPTGYSGINKITTGKWRIGEEPMEVVSGKLGESIVHYVAPPSIKMKQEMKLFLEWWNLSPENLDGLIRAGIAHLWFVTIHPFDDGNGRVARAITDMALAQDENTGVRLYSLSAQIMKERKKYYQILEKTQKGTGDITEWLCFFLEMFTCSVESSGRLIEKTFKLEKVFKLLEEKGVNERQKKVLKKLLESFPDPFVGGLTNKKYVSMTGVSPETAKRDIKDLVDKGILDQGESGGRSTNYQLSKDLV
ncbi:MAG: Fic family protein [Bacteriovoracaceae bacterium]